MSRRSTRAERELFDEWLASARRADRQLRRFEATTDPNAERRPAVWLLPRVAEELQIAARLRPEEWQGYLKTALCPEGILVSELAILKQQASAETTEVADATVAQFMTDIIRAGGDPGEWRGKCHSHGSSYALQWSSEDEINIVNHCTDWFVSLLLDSSGEMIARLDLILTDLAGTSLRVTLSDLPIFIDWLGDEVTCQRMAQILSDRVQPIPKRKQKPVPDHLLVVAPEALGFQPDGVQTFSGPAGKEGRTDHE